MRFLAALFLLLLAACATSPDAKVNAIREKKLPALEQQLAALDLQYGAPMFIRVFKEEGTLEVWLQKPGAADYALFKTYGVCAMSGGLGPKLASGDRQAPEGFYDVTFERLWPGSKYHLAMNIGYPNEYDEANGRTGHALMIHGDCKSDGCFAMTSPFIEEIYLLADGALRAGQESVPVHIFPFRMTEANLALHPGYPWEEFWRELKSGYDLFEASHIPPAPKIDKKRYIFASSR